MKRWFSSAWNNAWLAHSARTAVAAALALAIAELFKLPDAYGAPISTLVVTQSTLGAAWAVSKQRLIGTALGAVGGGLVASFLPPQIVTFAAAIFVLGLVCAALRLDQSAYRFAGITFAIVLLAARVDGAWQLGLYRFVEVSLGIAVGLAISALWPGRNLAYGAR